MSVTPFKCTKLSPFSFSNELLGATECSGMGKRIRKKTPKTHELRQNWFNIWKQAYTIKQIQIIVIKKWGFFCHAYSDQREMALNYAGKFHVRY